MNRVIEQFEILVVCVENDNDTDPLWQRFYRIQMTMFIFNNPEMKASAGEIHNAYMVIKESYRSFQTYLKNPAFRIRNIDNLIKSISVTNTRVSKKSPNSGKTA